MFIYAGIDEAGYGPMFGPLLVSRAVIGISSPESVADAASPPCLWQLLSKAVCRTLSDRGGRIPVNDSKKLHSASTGLKHLELGALTFAALAGRVPASVDQWLESLGESTHRDLKALPWYQPTPDQPWESLPCEVTPGEIAVARSVLTTAAGAAGVEVLDLGAAVVFEDRFNQMVHSTRSKAAVAFTFVAGHLRSVWDRLSDRRPTVVVDRQSGREHYRELLAMSFPDTRIRIMREDPSASDYLLESIGRPSQSMRVRFEVDGDALHFPVALASMVSKYTRELLMARFKAWFATRAPQIKPTAGYGRDAKRFWQELKPVLKGLAIEPETLRRSR